MVTARLRAPARNRQHDAPALCGPVRDAHKPDGSSVRNRRLPVQVLAAEVRECLSQCSTICLGRDGAPVQSLAIQQRDRMAFGAEGRETCNKHQWSHVDLQFVLPAPHGAKPGPARTGQGDHRGISRNKDNAPDKDANDGSGTCEIEHAEYEVYGVPR